MNNLITPIRSLILTPSQLATLDRLGRVTESTQLRMQHCSVNGGLLVVQVEQGELTVSAAASLIKQFDLAWAPRPLIRAAVQDLLVRRRQFASAVASGLPLPPSRSISGVGMIRAAATGHILVQGCSELIEVDQGLPDWIKSALQRQGSTVALNHSVLVDEGFGSGRWQLRGTQRIG